MEQMITLVRNAAEYLVSLENQDRQMIVEMTIDMIDDILRDGQLRPTSAYIRRYCDVVDGPEGADRIAAVIDAMDGQPS